MANDPFGGQVEYNGRWVSKKNFRVFVYGYKDTSLLANSYEEFRRAIDSGEWFVEKPLKKVKDKSDNGADSQRVCSGRVSANQPQQSDGTSAGECE